MKYVRSEKYNAFELMSKIMGSNPVKLAEELMENHPFAAGMRIMDLGSGQGLTGLFLSKEYGLQVYATDLWGDPEENQKFFDQMGMYRDQLIPVKADAMNLSFERDFFDGVDSCNYFGRDEKYLDEKLLPFVKSGGYILIAIPGMVQDCHDHLPKELLLSWNEEQMDYMHDVMWWSNLVAKSEAEVIEVSRMQSMDEVWNDWLMQENEYAAGDRKSMQAGAGKYLNFVKIVLRKR